MVGRVTTSGRFTDFPIPWAWDITPGPDGNLWISGGGSVFRMTPNGVVTQFLVHSDSMIGDIATGVDGHLWFWLNRPGVGYEIGRMTTTGAFKEFPLGASHVVSDLISANGGIWFSLGASAGGGVGSIGERGNIAYYFPQACDMAYGLSAATDGSLWFTCWQSMDVFVK